MESDAEAGARAIAGDVVLASSEHHQSQQGSPTNGHAEGLIILSDRSDNFIWPQRLDFGPHPVTRLVIRPIWTSMYALLWIHTGCRGLKLVGGLNIISFSRQLGTTGQLGNAHWWVQDTLQRYSRLNSQPSALFSSSLTSFHLSRWWLNSVSCAVVSENKNVNQHNNSPWYSISVRIHFGNALFLVEKAGRCITHHSRAPQSQFFDFLSCCPCHTCRIGANKSFIRDKRVHSTADRHIRGLSTRQEFH